MKKKFIYLLSFATILLSACSTDLDVKGNYKETMVVYGLLDQSQARQYIKVNKAFIGDGNAFSYAQVKDSTQYAHTLTVTLKKLPNGPEYTLLPDASVPKDPGIFYAPNQANAIYSNNDGMGHTVPMVLDSSRQYLLTLRNSETGTVAYSTTGLISDIGNFTSPSYVSPSFQFILAGASTDNFKFSLKWNSGANARLYQTIVRFNYYDSTATGNDTSHLDWVFPTQTTNGLVGNEQMETDFYGQDYLRFIGNQLNGKPLPLARIALKTDMILIAGSDDLNTFIEVNAPSTGIVQDKPEFTNITNGLGIFSSRLNKAPYSKKLHSTTVDSLSGGRFTCHLKFLNHLGIWTGCP